MSFLRKITNSTHFWPLLIVVVFAVLAARTLIFQSGYFNMHDDLQMMRQLEMEKCFLDGQIPCRWVPDMGYGYGFPLFNFYPPLPYLIGQVFRIVNVSFMDTAKYTFALSFVVSGITMYFLSKDFFGRLGGVISSAFYIWAPYHSVDVYVRGAMNEAWALSWFPLILWTAYRLIQEKKKPFTWMLGLSFSWVGLLLSHNLMVMIFTPVFACWVLMFWLKDKNLKKVFQFLFSGVLALFLAAFFTLPAILEQKFIHVDTLTQGYYEYIAHFATIGQLLTSRFWGYGPSVWMAGDGMPFQIGQAHWILSLIILGLALLSYSKVKSKPYFKIIVFGFAFGWFAAFMAHQNSTFIWQKIRPLSFVQFPWRFLTLVILGMSLVAGGIVKLIPEYTKKVVAGILLSVLLILNWNYFLPQTGKMGPLTDTEKFSGAAWDLQRTAGIFDYLPKTAKENPKDPPNSVAEYFESKGVVSNPKAGTNWASFDTTSSEDGVVRINLFEFPDWRVTIDDKVVAAYLDNQEKYGRMYLNVPKGDHKIYLKLQNTDIRTYSNVLSVVTWVLVVPLLYKKRNEINKKLA